MVTPEAKQRMLTNVWRESYMRLFKTLEQAQTDRDLYQRQAERLAKVLKDISNDIYSSEGMMEVAREVLDEWKLAQ